eukprot:SAG31_NODE_29942_length_388_cov_0.384083_1_plen_74_part_01
MRQYQLDVLTEMLVDYQTDGVEFDFAAPGGSAWFLPQSTGPSESKHLMTELVASTTKVARSCANTEKIVGVHIY